MSVLVRASKRSTLSESAEVLILETMMTAVPWCIFWTNNPAP
jgi:hypothetical protein